MRRYLVLVSLLALLAGGVDGASAQDATNDTDRVKSLVQPSIVFVKTEFSARVKDVNPRYAGTEFGGIQFGGEPITVAGRCTGFFVHPEGWVATAGHCILPDETQKQWIVEAAGLEALANGDFEEGTTEQDAIDYALEWFRVAGRVSTDFFIGWPTTSTSISSEETTGARRVGYRVSDQGDIGLLKFETSGVDMPGLELAGTDDVQVGTPIVAVGFPGSVDEVTDVDYNPSFKGGEISSIKTTGGGSVAVYEHDAATSGGMSGGPVVDSDGRVVGITSFGILGETEAFNFATPVALLHEVLSGKVTPDVGDVGRVYREGVEGLYDRDKSTALESFDEVLKHPGNPAVAVVNAGLRDRAIALPDEGGFPWWGYVLIVLGVLALAGAGAFLVLRQRQATPALAGVPTEAPARRVPASLPPGQPHADTVTGDGRPTLVIAGPRGETAVRHALEGSMVIGREAADILLHDEQVSRRHALVRVVDGRLELSDLNSANGTEVNGERISSTVTLAHGDTIRVGNTELKVELPESMRGARPSGETVITPGSS